MHQPDFIRLCLDLGVLRFGEFTLKSGRVSPYFFNAGLFNTGHAIASLGRHYARAAALSGIPFDMLFGPAYKGIPLVTTTAAALAEHEGMNLPYAFNRKEAKAHGEGGMIVGAPLAGPGADRGRRDHGGHGHPRVRRDHPCPWRDAGRRADRARPRGARPGRALRGAGGAGRFGLPVVSVLRLRDLMEHLEARGEGATLAAVRAYRDRYGV